MQLTASRFAQFLTQNEYFQVRLVDHHLYLSCAGSEERIPFSVWSGRIRIKRGLIWGSLQFFGNEKNGRCMSWLVQGLPWPECRQFACDALAYYQNWHDQQCRDLAQYLPQWEEGLNRLLTFPGYLSGSTLDSWRQEVAQQLQSLHMTLDEAESRIPQRIVRLRAWLDDPDAVLQTRNKHWMDAERERWQALFNGIESSPLNLSQQYAVLINDDHNLILAGAGSGKTSVLTARVAYLLQSQQVVGSEILLLAFGRDAANEMAQRLAQKIGAPAKEVCVSTFHQLGLKIIHQAQEGEVEISPLATDDNLRRAWLTDWLKKHWLTAVNFKRWQKHLMQWPIAYLKGDDDLESQSDNPQLIKWLDTQLMQLAALGQSKKRLQERLFNHAEYNRLNSELALCWPCYVSWQKMLRELNQVDFPTMISQATTYVRKGKFISPFKTVMVDEYQDISPDRLALIEALCATTNRQSGASLFAVGDDWQAIYQFAGADVTLTTGFKERFAHSVIHYLDTTYRFNSQIGKVANRFISQNPHQQPKELNSFNTKKIKCVHIVPMQRVEKVLDKLDRQSKQQRSVLLLGRNHYHKPDLYADWCQRFQMLNIEFMTCHASKGKEADFVIILSVDEGQFPARHKQAHLSDVFTGNDETYPDAEERRLFYVAMTRAREKVWIAHNGSGSAFVHELTAGDYPVVITR